MIRRDSTLPHEKKKQAPATTNRLLSELVAGGGAGAISRTLMAPLERVKVLLQIQESNAATNYRGIWDCLVRIPREQQGGVLAYWRGYDLFSFFAQLTPHTAME